MEFRLVNLWKYWKQTHDFTLIAVDTAHNGHPLSNLRVIIFNVGFILVT